MSGTRAIPEGPRARRLGTLAGRIWVADDFDAPMPEVEERFYDGEILPA